MAQFFSPENESANYGLAMGLLSGQGWGPTPGSNGPGLARGLAGYAQGREMDRDRSMKLAEQKQWQALAQQMGLEGVPASAMPGLVSKILEAQHRSPTESPSNIREYEYFEKLSPEQKERYLRVKRAEKFLDLGGEYGRVNPATANVDQRMTKTPPPEQMPEFKGDQARATAVGSASGEAAGQEQKNALGAVERERMYKMAEGYLDKSTGSGVGALADKSAAFFGKSTEGAEAADQLRIIGGTLTLKVPRMEGPQSNLDQQLYREIAGQLGDPTIPPERKRAAIATLRELDERYKHLNKEGEGGAFKVRRKIK